MSEAADVLVAPGAVERSATASARLLAAAEAFVDHYREPRVLGLDLMRIAASLTILMFHASDRASYYGAGPLKDGYLAVDLFFVLSGWLLTRQVIRLCRHSSGLGFVTRFWARRWLRTIPPYWVALAALALLGALGLVGSAYGLRGMVIHALFLQEIFRPNLFTVSWSLVAEEGFYLLLPFVVFLAFRLRRPGALAVLTVAALLLPTFIRASLVGSMSWIHLRELPQARFEGLVVGAALAAVALCRPVSWTALLRVRRHLASAGLAGIVLLLVLHRQDTWPFMVPGVLMFSIFAGCLIPWLSQLRWPAAAPVRLRMATTFLSDLTYPLYLVHVACFTLVNRFAYGHGKVGLVLAFVLVFAVATMLHVGVERPVLALRARVAGAVPAAA